MDTFKESIDIKPYTITELANIYGVKTRTMRNWIAPHQEIIGQKIGRIYTALQIKIIFEKLGLPAKAEE